MKRLLAVLSMVLTIIVALLVAAPANATPHSPSDGEPIAYITGGSFVSGDGADRGNESTPDTQAYLDWDCAQSKYAGPLLTVQRLGMNPAFYPCGGAEVKHQYLQAQSGSSGVQINHPEFDGAAVIITQPRGNPDLGRLIICYNHPFIECVPGTPEYDSIRADLIGPRAAEEAELFDRMNTRNPRAKKFSMGFPHIGPKPEEGPGTCAWIFDQPGVQFLSQAEVQSMYDLQDAFNDSIREVAGRKGFIYVDPHRAGSPWNDGSHDMCSADPWVHKHRASAPYNPADPLRSVTNSFHLKIEGQYANSVVLEQVIREAV